MDIPSYTYETCSVGTDRGYGYGYEAMGMGTGTGSRPWVWVRVQVRDHGYEYGYRYDMWQSHGYIIRVRVGDHSYGYGYAYGFGSRMSSRGWKTVGIITIATQHCTWVRACINTRTTSYVHNSQLRKNLYNIVSESRFVNKRASMNPLVKSSESEKCRFENLGHRVIYMCFWHFQARQSFGDVSHKHMSL